MTLAFWTRLRVFIILATLTCGVAITMQARADFLDDVRRTFQTDIPHFFQDDIPCAFGGQPTSQTKTSCKSPERPSTRAPAKAGDRSVNSPGRTNEVR